MKQRIFLVSALMVLLPILASAQTRSYAKFDSRGETIALFNLFKRTGPCEPWRTFTGTISSVRIQARGDEVDHWFTVRTKTRTYLFRFVLEKDEILPGDVEKLVTHKRSVKIKACLAESIWEVHEIARS